MSRLEFLPHFAARAAVAGIAALMWAGVANGAGSEKVLNLYNWSEYIGEDTVRNFEQETGIEVHYDIFDSNEILLSKMIAGHSGYDVIVPSSDFGRIMIDGGLVQKLDRKLLPNWQNLSQPVMRLMSKLDPGNRYMVPWMGGSVSVAYNIDKVKAALGAEPIPDDPYELVFNPKYASQLKSCGISMLDVASDVFPAALVYLNRRAYSNNPADYADAVTMLQKVRGDIGSFSANGYIVDLASGRICVALGYGGDFNNAIQRAKNAGNHVRITAPLPPRGGPFGFDSMMIPADAPHVANAHKWIDYIMRADVQAAITNKVKFTSPNAAARKLILPDLLANPIAFPPDDYLATKAQFYEVRLPATRRLMTRAFTRFKSGM